MESYATFIIFLWIRCLNKFEFAIQLGRILSSKFLLIFVVLIPFKMAKVMTTPIMALLQFAFYGKRFTRGILATLGLVCVGVCLATATEFTLTLMGFSVAFAACFVTAIYSIVRRKYDKNEYY